MSKPPTAVSGLLIQNTIKTAFCIRARRYFYAQKRTYGVKLRPPNYSRRALNGGKTMAEPTTQAAQTTTEPAAQEPAGAKTGEGVAFTQSLEQRWRGLLPQNLFVE